MRRGNCTGQTVGCGGTVVAQQVETQRGSPATEQPQAAATAGQPKEVVNTIGMKLLLIPAGTFMMRGNTGFVTRSFTGFEVSTRRVFRSASKYPGSAQVFDACGA
ncbi:MAG: hypothetical protein ACKO3T_10950 [Planctomycetaceae bacterium]